MTIVLNRCYGGFSVSQELVERWNTAHPDEFERNEYSFDSEAMRMNPEFIKLVEEMGTAANGSIACLEVVEIPDSVTDWRIDAYDGAESVLAVLEGKLADF